jgi:hypothetical protein
VKCQCDNCNGSGRVECEECDGVGSVQGGIDAIDISFFRNHENFEELAALKSDVARVNRQAERLILLNPSRAESYQAQLQSTLAEIDRQAELASKESK